METPDKHVLVKQLFELDDRKLMVTVELIDQTEKLDTPKSELDEVLESDEAPEEVVTIADVELDGAVDEVETPSFSETSPLEPQPIATISPDDEHNPLLLEDSADEETQEAPDSMSLVSAGELIPTDGELPQLHPDDPRTILTWNCSGNIGEAGRKRLWESFMKLVESTKPDIVVLQNVKL